jgi:hypothetical protein
MDNGLNSLLESGLLNEATKTQLEEAWNAKLDEVRASVKEEVESQVREEFSVRFEADKGNLVEAMDNMLTDAVKQYAAESVAATRSLNEQRNKLTATIKEARADYKAKVSSHSKMLEAFVMSQLAEELKGISEDHRAIQKQRVRLAKEISEAKASYETKLSEQTQKLESFVLSKLSEQIGAVKKQEQALAEQKTANALTLREHRTSLNEQTAARINKLEGFVLEQLNKELVELEEDKNALVEAKVRLVAESKAKLDETKKAFVARASALVEKTIDAQIRGELTALKEDIKEARNNMFGRRLFEAFHTEFMTSYLSEGSEVRKLNTKLSESASQLEAANRILSEKNAEIQASARRAKLAEERATRVQVKNELLSPLSKEKRNVMEELLDTVKTEKLKEAFQKYLPTVLSEGMRSATQGRRVLSETPVATKTVAVTGNRVNPTLAESARAEDVQATRSSMTEIAELRRLAGIEE